MASPDITLPEHNQLAPSAEKASKLNAVPESPAKTLKAIEFRREKAPQEKVGIRQKTEDEYKVFLNNYIAKISRAADKNPSLRASNAAKMGIQLMEKLTTDGKPDPEKIGSFLTEEKGWVITTEAINEQILLLNAVTGFVAETKPPSKPGELLEKAKIRIEGARWFGWLGAPDSPLAAKFIKFKDGRDLFDMIKKDPDLKNYTAAVTGIDLDDYEANWTLTKDNPHFIRKLPGAPKDNRTPEDIRKEALEYMEARRDFLTDLGIPSKLIDSMPEEALLREAQRFAQTGLVWEQEIIDRFRRKLDSLLAGTGNPSDLQRHHVTIFNDARREIMLHYIAEIKINKAIKHPSTTKSGVEQRLAGIDQEKTRRTQEAENKIKTLGEEKGALTSEKATIDTYNATKTTSQQGLENYRNEFGAAGLAGRSISQEMERVTKSISDETDPNSIESRLRDLPEQLKNEINTARNNAYATIQSNIATGSRYTPKDIDSALERAEQQVVSRSERTSQRLNAEKARLEQQQARLKELETAVDTNQKTVNQNEDAIVGAAKEDIDVVLNNFSTIRGWAITETQLRSLSEDQLLSAINAINIADPTRGWSKTANPNSANRQILIDAITEAKAKQSEQLDTDKPNRDIEYNAVTSWGTPNITPEQLRTASVSQLMTLVNNANAVDRTHGWNATTNEHSINIGRLNKAIKEAKNRLVLRHNISIQERIKDFDSQVQTQTELVENIKKDIDKKKDALTLAKIVGSRQQDIYKQAWVIPTNVPRYHDFTVVGDTDKEYSPTERGLHQPKVYFEMLDLLFDYKRGGKVGDDTLTREEYFVLIHKVLPPPKLEALIDEATGSRGFPYDQLTLFTTSEIVGSLQKMVNKLGEEAIAL